MTENLDDFKASDIRDIASEDMCKTLLESLILLIRTQKKPWDALPKTEQDDVIESLRKSVRVATDAAVRLISSNAKITVQGQLEQVTIKDGIKAQIVISRGAQNLQELFDAVLDDVLIVCSGNPVYDRGLDQVQGEDDQRSFDLGQEYDENRTLEDEKALGYEPEAKA